MLSAQRGLCGPCYQCDVLGVGDVTCFGSQSRRENMLLQVGCVTHSDSLLKGVAAGAAFTTSSHAPTTSPASWSGAGPPKPPERSGVAVI